MMKSPMIKWTFMISYWIVTIAALNLGLVPVLGYNALEKVLTKMNLGSLFMPIHYVVGIAALISLFSLLMWKSHSCHCNE